MSRPARYRRRRAAFTLIELLVVMAIIGVLIALLLPAVQACRSAARRTQCIHNEMQVGIAMQNYETAFESFPPGVVDRSGPITNQPVGYGYSWIAQILPFLDQQNTYNHLNFQLSVYDPANSAARGVKVATLLCPADAESYSPTHDGFGQTSLMGAHNSTEAPINDTNDGVLYLNSRIAMDDIPDGASHTLLFGEAKHEIGLLGWASGSRSTLRNGGSMMNAPIPASTKANPYPVGGFSSWHAGGSNFAMADGSVRFLKNGVGTSVLQRLINRKDGELLSDGSF